MAIVIKGIKQGVLVNLEEHIGWQALIDELVEQVEQRQSFFAGSQWIVDLKGRALEQAAINQLKELFESRQMSLLALLSTHAATCEAAKAMSLFTSLEEIPAPERTPATEAMDDTTGEYVVPPVDSEEYGTGGVLIKRTLRSGRTVRSMGHVVVIGDVNPGAEIVAAGDVVVWGKVRGVIHAGAMGDETAVVCALDLAPTQLRIGNLISIPPQEKRRVSRPEMAQVNRGQIEVISWNGN